MQIATFPVTNTCIDKFLIPNTLFIVSTLIALVLDLDYINI